MKEILKKAQSNFEAGLPFAVYAKPGSNTLCGVFQKEAGTYYLEDFNEPGFVFAPFEGVKRLFIPNAASEIKTDDVEKSIDNLPEIHQSEIDPKVKEAFEALVSKSITAINSGKFEKLVCSRTETMRITHNAQDIYIKLHDTYPNAFRYWFFHPEAGMWMGATPEQLLKADSSTIHTVALAGTQLYKEGEEALWPEKEKQEQRFVTDYIINELDGLVNTIETTNPYTYRAGNIIHIKTDIKARLKQTANLKDVVEKLHPTPAVCGLPKEAAKQFLLHNEGYGRECYSGFLGEVNCDSATGENGKTDLFVNLRCIKVENNTARLFIGCGITKDSDPEKEFIETVNKSMTMRKVLG